MKHDVTINSLDAVSQTVFVSLGVSFPRQQHAHVRSSLYVVLGKDRHLCVEQQPELNTVLHLLCSC